MKVDLSAAASGDAKTPHMAVERDGATVKLKFDLLAAPRKTVRQV